MFSLILLMNVIHIHIPIRYALLNTQGKLPELKLSSNIVNEIETAGRVHDVGKITIEDSILRKAEN